jgi:sugar transferase EpsL
MSRPVCPNPQIYEELRREASEGLTVRRRLGLGAKRALDVLLSAVGLILTGPLIVLLTVLVRRDSPGGAFFTQKRLGRYGTVFAIHKLRTMVAGAERTGAGLAIERDDPRITKVGGWLRRLSLDELPQLWDVLRGQMSLVGPRPLLVQYLERWSPDQRRRLLMPQGMTGWAQVNGRNAVDWEAKFGLDTWYVDHWSLWLDVRVLVRTVWAVLTRRGIMGDAGVPEFRGFSDG